MRWDSSGRSLVLVSLVGALLVLAAGREVRAQEPRFDGTTLRVATWGGTWRDALHEVIGKELEKRGAKVEYVLGNPADSFAKLIAARGRDIPFDVMEIGDPQKPQLVEGQFLEALNVANLPNSGDLDPAQREQYVIATGLSEGGIVYNVKKFEELGIPKPDRFTGLLHPKLAGKVSLPDINVGPAVTAIVGFAAEAGGDEGRIDGGLELIRKLQVVSFYKSAVELATKFNTGDVWAAVWHAGWALRLRKAGVPAGITFPKVKDRQGLATTTWIGIPKGGKARRAAEFFINQYLDPDAQVKISGKLGQVPVKKGALAKLGDDPELREIMLLTPAQIRNMYYLDWSRVNFSEWVSKWSRAMAQ